MDNKNAAILVLAIAAALVIAASATYAMVGRQAAGSGNPYGSNSYGYGMGPSMMGGSVGYPGGMMGGYSHAGGMMGGYGMMGGFNDTGSMYQYMQQHMWRYWNSTATP